MSKLNPLRLGHLQHVQMNVRILVAGEPDVAQLPGLTRLEQRRVGPLLIEDPMGILVSENLVMLDQVDVIHLQALE